MRCATAYEALKDYQETVEHCEQLLKLEPNNKRCQELLNKVRQHYVPDASRDTNRKKGRRIKIEETDEKIDDKTAMGIKMAATDNQSTKSRDTSTEKVPTKTPDPLTSSVTAPIPSLTTPTRPPPLLPANVQFLKDSGNELFRVGQYGAAVSKYTKAIELLEKGGQYFLFIFSILFINLFFYSRKRRPHPFIIHSIQ